MPSFYYVCLLCAHTFGAQQIFNQIIIQNMKIKSHHFLVTLMLFLTFNLSFSQKIITGNVSDESGVPLPGVNVTIKGTQTGTSTDFDGNYSITTSDNDVLSFSFVGFLDQEIDVANADSFNVSLEMGSDELEER